MYQTPNPTVLTGVPPRTGARHRAPYSETADAHRTKMTPAPLGRHAARPARTREAWGVTKELVDTRKRYTIPPQFASADKAAEFVRAAHPGAIPTGPHTYLVEDDGGRDWTFTVHPALAEVAA